MKATQTTAPGGLPVSVAEAKAWLKIETSVTDDDSLVESLIEAAVAHLDGVRGILGRAIVEQSWIAYFDAFPSLGLRIPLPPLLSIDSIQYYDADNTLQTLSAASYDVDAKAEPAMVLPVSTGYWPSTYLRPNAVQVAFTCGWAAGETSPTDYGANVPADLKTAIKALVAHWYENREPVGAGTLAPLPLHVEALLTKHKVWY